MQPPLSFMLLLLFASYPYAVAESSDGFDILNDLIDGDELVGGIHARDSVDLLAVRKTLEDIPFPALDKTLDLGFATLSFVLQPKCSALSQDFGVDFKTSADTDSCISAILNQTFSVKDVANLAGFDVGSVTSKIPSFLGITKEKVEGISVKGLALKYKLVGNSLKVKAACIIFGLWDISLGIAGLRISTPQIALTSDGAFDIRGVFGVTGKSVDVGFGVNGNWKAPLGGLVFKLSPSFTLQQFADSYGIGVLLTPFKLPGLEAIGSLQVSSIELTTSEDGTSFATGTFVVNMAVIDLGLVTAKEISVTFSVDDPFTDSRRVTAVNMPAKYNIFKLEQLAFDATLTYQACPYTVELQQTFADSFTVSNPFGIAGLSFQPLFLNYKVWRGNRSAIPPPPSTKSPTTLVVVSSTPTNSPTQAPTVNHVSDLVKKLQEPPATKTTAPPTVKGQCDDNLQAKNQDITLRARVSFGDIFGPLKPYMPTSVEGELAMKRTDGKSDGYSISATVDMASMAAIGPLRLADWGIVYETDGKAYTLTGSIHVILSISGQLHIYASVGWDSAAKTLTLTWDSKARGDDDYLQIIPGAGLADIVLKCVIDTQGKLLKELSFSGTFRTKEAKLGPLSDAIAALDGIRSALIFKMLDATSYSFRIEIGGKINVKSDAVEVLNSGMYFEIGGKIPDFQVGGFVELKLKVGGDATNYPIVYVGIGFELLAARLVLEGGLKGSNPNDPALCWQKAFGVKGLAVCDVKILLGITAVFPFLTKFSFQGAIKIGSPTAPAFTFLIGIHVDLQKPTENCFIGQLNSTLTVTQLVEVGLGLVGIKITMPTIPVIRLNSITIKVAARDMEIAGIKFSKGMSFDADFVFLGVAIKAGFGISETSIYAYFSSTRLAMLDPVLVLCKDSACRPEEGPSFEFRVSWGGTPTLLVKLDAFINFIGITMGVKIYITYSDWINFRAEFYLRPMDLLGGVIKISDAVAKSGNAVRTNGPQPSEFAGGPYAIFDSKALSIDVSGSVCVLFSCSSIIVQVSKEKLYFQQSSTFLGFPFAISVWANFGSLPLKFGTKWEAGSEGTSIKTTIRDRVNSKLDELKKSGEGAIKDAQNKLQSAKDKVNNICEEVADLELLEKIVRAHKATRGRKLLAMRGSESSDATLVDGLLSDTVTTGDKETNLIQAKAGSRTKWHTHWPHRHHIHIPHRWHVHLPVPTPQEIWEAAQAAARAAAKLACDGLKATANLALTVAQKFLDGVLLANSAAFAVMKAITSAVTAVLLVDYVSIEAELSSNILQSYVAGKLQFTIGGKQYSFAANINLSDLGSIVTDIFNKVVDYFKSLFPVEEATAMLQQQHYSSEAMAAVFRPENLFLVQMKLGHFNKAGARSALRAHGNDPDAADPLPEEIVDALNKQLGAMEDSNHNQDHVNDFVADEDDTEVFDPTADEKNAEMRAEHNAEIARQLAELTEQFDVLNNAIAEAQETFLIQQKAKREQLIQEAKAKLRNRKGLSSKPPATRNEAAAVYTDSAYERLLQRLENIKNDATSTALIEAKWGAVGAGVGAVVDGVKAVGSAAVGIFNSGICKICMNQLAGLFFSPVTAGSQALCAVPSAAVAGIITGSLVGADFGVLGTATGLLLQKACSDAISDKALTWTKMKTYGTQFSVQFCNFATLCKDGKE